MTALVAAASTNRRHENNTVSPTGMTFLHQGLISAIDDSSTDNRHRHYAHALGRFSQRDLLGPSFASRSVNLYEYVGSNPLSFTDPSGAIPPGVYCPGWWCHIKRPKPPSYPPLDVPVDSLLDPKKCGEALIEDIKNCSCNLTKHGLCPGIDVDNEGFCAHAIMHKGFWVDFSDCGAFKHCCVDEYLMEWRHVTVSVNLNFFPIPCIVTGSCSADVMFGFGSYIGTCTTEDCPPHR